MTICRRVDPVHLASREEQIAGHVPVKSFTRLSNLLQTSDGNVQVLIAFGKGEIGYPIVQGDIKANVVVECQRCLQSMPLQLDTEFRLVAMDMDSDASDSDGLFDAVLMDDGEIDLYDLIEDELVMAMPMVPMHALADHCSASGKYFGNPDEADSGASKSQRPFKDLGKMMSE